MITKDLLEDVVAFEKYIQMVGGNRAVDVFTLHFRQWWKQKKVLSYACDTTDINEENNTFSYSSTAQAMAFHNILVDHINASYIGKEDEILLIKCPVVQLVPKTSEDDDK